MVPPLLGVTPIFAVSFWVCQPYLHHSFAVLFNSTVLQGYDTAKMLILKATPNREKAELSLGELGIAGFLSAVPATAVAAPVERAKVLLQVCERLFRTSYLVKHICRFKGKERRDARTQVFLT